MSRDNKVGTTYLIHFDRPYKHAKHYVGWARSLEARIAHHRNGTGARLLQVLNQAGIGWEVVRTWPDTTREFERHLEDTRHVPGYCPVDQPERSAARREAREKGKTMSAEQDVTSLNEVRDQRIEAAREQIQDEPIVEPKPGTLGELVTRMWSGEVSREQVMEAIKGLDVLHWDIPVRQPEVGNQEAKVIEFGREDPELEL